MVYAGEVFVLLELVSLPSDKLVAVDVVVMTFLDSLWLKRFVVIKKLLPEKYYVKASDYVNGTDTMLNINNSCISYMRLDLYIKLLNIHKLQDLLEL